MAVRFAEIGGVAFAPASGPRAPFVAALGISGIAAAALVSPDRVGAGPVICPFRLLTGLPCPGCGLTRSWVYLMHGRWSEAISANPFGSVLLAATLALTVMVIGAMVRRRPVPTLTGLLDRRPVRIVALAWVAFGVVRAALVLTGHASA
jgi:hypothetical protein